MDKWNQWLNGVRDQLLDKLAINAYTEAVFRLSAGDASNEYLDCRRALSDPNTLYLAAAVIWNSLNQSVNAVGGLTMGADPLSIGVSMYSQNMGNLHPVRWFSVRKTPRTHGLRRSVEGHVRSDERVTILEDVVTSGASVVKAVDICRKVNLQVVQIVTLVDREVGGLKAIEAVTGIKPDAVFTKDAIAERHKHLCTVGSRAR